VNVRRRSALLAAQILVMLLVPACRDKSVTCSGGLREYKDKCLTDMAIVYTECTDGRGVNTTTEIGGGVGGTLRVVAGASLQVAYRTSQQEDTPVALEIVRNCMEIAKSSAQATDPEQSIAAEYLRQFDQAIQQWLLVNTPHVSLSTDTARSGDQITVTGTQFLPNEVVDIRLHTSILARVTADSHGSFSTVITVPANAPPPNFDTAVVATGESSIRSARAPFRTSA